MNVQSTNLMIWYVWQIAEGGGIRRDYYERLPLEMKKRWNSAGKRQCTRGGFAFTLGAHCVFFYIPNPNYESHNSFSTSRPNDLCFAPYSTSYAGFYIFLCNTRFFFFFYFLTLGLSGAEDTSVRGEEGRRGNHKAYERPWLANATNYPAYIDRYN